MDADERRCSFPKHPNRDLPLPVTVTSTAESYERKVFME
jgi:hypothetical protein